MEVKKEGCHYQVVCEIRVNLVLPSFGESLLDGNQLAVLTDYVKNTQTPLTSLMFQVICSRQFMQSSTYFMFCKNKISFTLRILRTLMIAT